MPIELHEAARIEGCGLLGILWRVYVPLAKRTYLAYVLMSVSTHWNTFLWPLIVTNSPDTRLLTVGLSIFGAPENGVDIGVISGNHDARGPMCAAFADQFAPQGALNWNRQVGDVTVIGLVDTLMAGTGQGTYSPQMLRFVRASLETAKGSPVLLALHHPPFASGTAFMDATGLTNRAAFCDIVAAHAGPLRIICGHIHAMMITVVGGHIAVSAPSPCSTFAYDRRAEGPVGYHTLEDGCLLHRWDGSFQTIRIGPQAGAGLFPF